MSLLLAMTATAGPVPTAAEGFRCDGDLKEVQARADARRGKALVAKGFHLGMPISDACTLLRQVEKLQPATVQLIDGLPMIEIRQPAESGGRLLVRVSADADGHVVGLYLRAGIVDQLFGSQDMDPETFAKTFAASYGIGPFRESTVPLRGMTSNLGVGTIGEQTQYDWTGRDGVRVTIHGLADYFDPQAALLTALMGEDIPSPKTLRIERAPAKPGKNRRFD